MKDCAKSIVKETEIASTLLARDYKGFGNQEQTGVYDMSEALKQVGVLTGGAWDKMFDCCKRVYDPGGISPTLNAHGGGHTEIKILVPEATKKGYADAGIGDSINLAVPNSQTRRGRVGHGMAQTLTTAPQQAAVIGGVTMCREYEN